MLKLILRLLGITVESSALPSIRHGDRGLICGWDHSVEELPSFPFRADMSSGELIRSKDPANLRWRAVQTGACVSVELFVPEKEWDGPAVFTCDTDFFTAHFIHTFNKTRTQ